MPQTGFRIIEFHPKYEDEVKVVIGKVLKDIGVLPDLEGPIDDEDLCRIPEIYCGKGRFWLAIKDDKVIGTVAIREIDEETAKLNRMFVLVDHHGTGVGQALLDKALTFARNQGFQKVILNTHLLMSRAHRFYEKNGFANKTQVKDEYFYELDLK